MVKITIYSRIDDIEMLFYKIAIGMSVAFEFSNLYQKIHKSISEKVDKYIKQR